MNSKSVLALTQVSFRELNLYSHFPFSCCCSGFLSLHIYIFFSHSLSQVLLFTLTFTLYVCTKHTHIHRVIETYTHRDRQRHRERERRRGEWEGEEREEGGEGEEKRKEEERREGRGGRVRLRKTERGRETLLYLVVGSSLERHNCHWLENDAEQGLVGFLRTKILCVPHFFGYRKQPSFSLHGLPWVPVGRFKQLLIGEERGACETREKQSRIALGQGPVSP